MNKNECRNNLKIVILFVSGQYKYLLKRSVLYYLYK